MWSTGQRVFKGILCEIRKNVVRRNVHITVFLSRQIYARMVSPLHCANEI
ncbi:hypothetical protein DSOL_1611 [Desulfosporosinus metallidurans]|uniref:Uncharacterized protein n=1 Tax=Desulfosporosinus metallidurans TaxID=1888891 RepID=A0A1Q8QYZ8_9FIRM|nr:hypothetical protein DSOL_1611 [Desulfosporosinus metallidurans]